MPRRTSGSETHNPWYSSYPYPYSHDTQDLPSMAQTSSISSSPDPWTLTDKPIDSFGIVPPSLLRSKYDTEDTVRSSGLSPLGSMTTSSDSGSRAMPMLPKKLARKEAPYYPCLQSGCDASFRRVTDLKRHSNAVHNPQLIDCPYAHVYCGRTGENGFSRKDHLNEHIREVHKRDPAKRPSKAVTKSSRR